MPAYHPSPKRRTSHDSATKSTRAPLRFRHVSAVFRTAERWFYKLSGGGVGRGSRSSPRTLPAMTSLGGEHCDVLTGGPGAALQPPRSVATSSLGGARPWMKSETLGFSMALN